MLCAALATGCRSTQNRPVAEQGDAAQLWSVLRRPALASPSVQALELLLRAGGAVATDVARSFEPLGARPGDRRGEVGAAGEYASTIVDLGLPIFVDFGVVEAPYDDGTAPLHGGEVGSGGFSGSVLSVLWRSPLPSGLVLQGQAALVRDQDLDLLDGLGDARFGFAVLGLCMSF